jgi:sucrose-6-phosphate hydrolase SacC (GH32 family)
VLVHGKLLNPFDHTEHWRSWFYHPDTGELIRPQNPPESQIRHISRDPKLFWHEPTKKWIMVVYEQDTYEAYDGKSCTFAVYSSDKATEWRKESVIPGWYECPELFELDVDADPDKRKWVLLGGDGRYVIGDFDGKAFHFEPRRPDEFDPYMTSTKFLANETYKYMGFYGKSMFAPQTFNDMPKEDGRRIQIGWLKCNMAHMPFNQMMSLPCELFLRTTEDGIRMFTRPVEELEQLRGKSYRWTGEDDQTTYRLDEDGDGLLEIVARIRIGTDETGIEIDGIKIAYNPENRKLRCELSTDSVVEAPLKAIQNEIRLHVFRDRTSIELFANDGRVHMPVAVPPDRHGPTVPSVRRLGPEPFVSLDIYALNSIWSDTDGNPA